MNVLFFFLVIFLICICYDIILGVDWCLCFDYGILDFDLIGCCLIIVLIVKIYEDLKNLY